MFKVIKLWDKNNITLALSYVHFITNIHRHAKTQRNSLQSLTGARKTNQPHAW